MNVRATTDDPPATGADTIVVGIFEGKGVPHDVDDGALGALVASGEARAGFRKLTHAHAAGTLGRAQELGAEELCWELPHKVPDAVAGALVEGTLLAAYRYTAFKSDA